MTANDLLQLAELLVIAAEKMERKARKPRPATAAAAAKRALREKGWSQRRAAKKLGVRQEHLNLVLNGKRTSARLLLAISTLPTSPVPYRMVGFAVR